MKESPFIEQIVLVGDNKRFVSALIVPGFSKLKEWAKQHGIEYTSNEAIVKNPMVIATIDSVVAEYNQLFNWIQQPITSFGKILMKDCICIISGGPGCGKTYGINKAINDAVITPIKAL